MKYRAVDRFTTREEPAEVVNQSELNAEYTCSVRPHPRQRSARADRAIQLNRRADVNKRRQSRQSGRSTMSTANNAPFCLRAGSMPRIDGYGSLVKFGAFLPGVQVGASHRANRLSSDIHDHRVVRRLLAEARGPREAGRCDKDLAREAPLVITQIARVSSAGGQDESRQTRRRFPSTLCASGVCTASVRFPIAFTSFQMRSSATRQKLKSSGEPCARTGRMRRQTAGASSLPRTECAPNSRSRTPAWVRRTWGASPPRTRSRASS
jgi:hypothetical protein